jgi:endonuclease/exonuclease/phosphatase (EEP) superfamily protein YafD
MGWLVAAGLIALLVIRMTGYDYWYPMTQIVAFMPYYVVPGTLTTALFLVQKRWYSAALTALVSFAISLLIVPRLMDSSTATPAGMSIRVMSLNLRIGGADAEDIATLAKKAKVDVITFQEFTPEAQERLDADLSQFPYRSIHPRELALGSAIYSRLPMTDDGVRRHQSGFYQAQGTLNVPGGGQVRVESAHPCAPTGAARSACWKRDLADQPPAEGGGKAQILLGDFNATLDHAGLRKLLSTGYVDAASSVGMGLTPTWPYDRPVPKIAIDHILFNSGISASKFAVHDIGGTDHRCIIAELTIRSS